MPCCVFSWKSHLVSYCTLCSILAPFKVLCAICLRLLQAKGLNRLKWNRFNNRQLTAVCPDLLSLGSTATFSGPMWTKLQTASWSDDVTWLFAPIVWRYMHQWPDVAQWWCYDRLLWRAWQMSEGWRRSLLIKTLNAKPHNHLTNSSVQCRNKCYLAYSHGIFVLICR